MRHLADGPAAPRPLRSDPITIELVRYALQTLVDEMAFTLGRTCASQLIREVQDFSTGICDCRGNLLALSITQPGTIGIIPGVLANVIAVFGDSACPGDVYIVNDPYHGGTHLNDLHIVKPVFKDGELVAYVTSKAHHTDIGGKVPGSMSFDNVEIFQDGLRLPPLRLFTEGRVNDCLWKILALNVRYPEVLFSDISAQVAALDVGELRLIELLSEHGREPLQRYFEDLLDHGERVARQIIATWPDGTYEFEDYCDSDGVSGHPIVIHVAVTIKDDEIWIDFAGTSPQVAAAVNFPSFEAASCAQLVVQCCYGPSVPTNGGIFRPVHVTVPPGSILNPRPPAACSERGLVVYRVGDAVFGAFAQIVPNHVTAAGEGGSYLMRFGGQDADGKDFLCVDLVQGTWGARVSSDGIDGLSNIQANHTNTPVEVLESNFPIRVEMHALVPDTGGPGKHRGGLALARAWRYLGTSKGVFRSRADRHRFPPYGLFGGGPGEPSHLTLQRSGSDASTVELDGKAVVELQHGDVVRLQIAGGGGWGSPRVRSPESVLVDVRHGKVSEAAARRAYGVVLTSGLGAVDTAATDTERSRRFSADG